MPQNETDAPRSSELVRELLDSSKQGMMILDDQNRIVAFSRVFERWFGLEHREMVGRDVRELIAGRLYNVFEVPEDFIASWLRQFTSGIHASGVECCLVPTENRRGRWLEHWSRPIGEGPFAGGRIEVFSDITMRKRTEEALRVGVLGASGETGEQFFQTLVNDLTKNLELDFAQVGLIETEPSDGTTTSSMRRRRVRTLARSKKGIMIGERLYNLAGTPCEKILGRRLRSFPENAYRRFPKDLFLQEHLIESYVGVPLIGPGGRPMGLLSVMHRGPMTGGETASVREVEARLKTFVPRLSAELERWRELEELRGAVEAAQVSEARYNHFFESSQDVILVSDLAGGLLDVNRVGLEVLGLRADELATADFSSFWQDKEQFHQTLQELKDRSRLDHFEVRWAKPEARVLQGSASVLGPQRRESGLDRHVLWTLRDQTQHRSLEEQLRQSQKMEAIGRIAGGLAHDFNNLLTAINGYAQMIKKSTNDDSQGIYLDEIIQAGRRAGELTSKMLTLSRRSGVDPQVVDCNQMIKDLDALVRQLVGEDVRIEHELSEELGNVLIDVGQMEQVLLNLALNARDAMKGGGLLTFRTANLDIPVRRLEDTGADLPHGGVSGPYVRISVGDNGSGIPEEIRDKIFEPFFTTKEDDQGTGLGLSTAYATLVQNRGFIEVDSKVGAGTTFHLYLPRVERELTEKTLAFPAESSAVGTERILLVEDNGPVRMLVRDLLEQEGYSVIEASSADEALHLVQDITVEEGDQPVDLLVSDVVMPGLSGPALAERLHGLFPTMKVLFITGYANKVLAEHGLSGRETMLHKPLDIQQLASKVRWVLDRPTSG